MTLLPSWSEEFKHVFWSEHCVIRSNSPNLILPPEGSGLEIGDNGVFHLSLLRQRLWGRDDFWYLAFLPRNISLSRDPLLYPLSTPFDLLPIKKLSDGQWRLAPNIIDTWIRLEWHVVVTYNILKQHFGGLVPIGTTLPPCPKSTSFFAPHPTEDEARRACHRARRYFLPWLCLITTCIARSTPACGPGPSEWFKILADFRPALEPFWLDNIAQSPMLMCLDHSMPRRGLAVNMAGKWSFLHGFPFLHYTSVPIWLCFPHEASLEYGLARSLRPSSEAIESARNHRGPVQVDSIQSVPPLPKDILNQRCRSTAPEPPSRVPSPTPSHDDPIDPDDDLPPGPADIDSVLDLTSRPFIDGIKSKEVAELDHLTFSISHMDEFLDVLKFRYGIILPKTLIRSTCTISGRKHSKSLLLCLRGMVQEKVLDDLEWQYPNVIAILEEFASTILAKGIIPPQISDCHADEKSFLLDKDTWKLDPCRIRIRDTGMPFPLFYAFRTPDSKTLGRVIAVKGLVSMREVLRRGWGPLHMDIMRPLWARGMPVLLGYLKAPRVVMTPINYIADVFRPKGYHFQSQDYRSYVHRRLSLFKDHAVAQPALGEGGILWRLAMESEVDIDTCQSEEHIRDAYQVMEGSVRDAELWVTVLPDAIADTLVGMYKLYTGEFMDDAIYINTLMMFKLRR